MSREEAYEQAAVCYRRVGYNLEAARCYRLAGAHRRAAELYEASGLHTEAAISFADAGLPELGAWLLVHHAGLPAQARALLGTPVLGSGTQARDADSAMVPGRAGGVANPPGGAREPKPPSLRPHLVLARCEIAEGAAPDVIRPVIADVCAALADASVRSDQVTEEWGVALSEAAARYDQAALVFAAAVRGGRYGAEHRWRAWSARVLGAEVILPARASTTPAVTTAA